MVAQYGEGGYLCADSINPHEGAADKWRETDAEDRADVCHTRARNDAILHAERGLLDEA